MVFSTFVNDEFHDNIVWPDLPYLTDEHGSKWWLYAYPILCIDFPVLGKFHPLN